MIFLLFLLVGNCVLFSISFFNSFNLASLSGVTALALLSKSTSANLSFLKSVNHFSSSRSARLNFNFFPTCHCSESSPSSSNSVSSGENWSRDSSADSSWLSLWFSLHFKKIFNFISAVLFLRWSV